MVTPRNAKDVAWLDQGGFPGRTQNAVLAGHINYSRVPGTFRNIKNLGPGDRVFVNLDGARWEFAVTWVCTFDPSTNLAEQIMGYTNVPSITLVTCGGTFDRRLGTHNRRTVVRAELVASA
jgi:LPXTG-site transpeptidase (sortase) family protein